MKALEFAEYKDLVAKAVRYYWSSAERAVSAKQLKGVSDQGKRGRKTSGGSLNGFSAMLGEEIKKVGQEKIDIHLRKSLVTLPGYFRATKQWDLVVLLKGRLVAVIELKSLGGPSYSNNANNRCEEAIGSGVDFRIAQRKGAYGTGVSPFLGYLILVEDEEDSRNPPKRETESLHFSKFPEFKGASHQKRMAILCERLIQEEIYDAAAAISSPPEAVVSGEFTELSSKASLRRLLVQAVLAVEAEVALDQS